MGFGFSGFDVGFGIMSVFGSLLFVFVFGMFIVIAGSSPRLNFTSGVLRLTFAGTHSAEEYPGINKYSLNVRDVSFIYFAISLLLF